MLLDYTEPTTRKTTLQPLSQNFMLLLVGRGEEVE